MFSSSHANGLLPKQTECPPYHCVLNTVFFQEPDALGLVPIKPVDVKIRHVLPFYDLKVSQYSPPQPYHVSLHSPVKHFVPDSVAPVCSPVEKLP